ncbi:MAG: PLP-dependent aminotransferase family protein [Verrucomicrobia bacterium]|nr:PLP-dependent aminotransferase family protein [Verrucomicrobiota bacterium]
MARRTDSIALVLPTRAPEETAGRWLTRTLRAEVLEGRLRTGSRLPATRDLAAQYGLSRGTIVNAFEELKAEGYLQGAVGSGTRVSAVLPDDLLAVRVSPGTAPRQSPVLRRYTATARRARPLGTLDPLPARAFRANQPALDLFPTSLWAQLSARRWRRASVADLLGTPALGFAPLREAVADYLRQSRGVRCQAEQVVIVSGVQESLALTAQLFVEPGDAVAFEDPGYLGARRVFETLGARLCPLSVDAEGMRPPSRRLAPRLIYCTPAHQFPLGLAMSLPRRLALLARARSLACPIFEDDYDSEYRYSGRPLPALQGLDQHGLVYFAGSFNKVLFPSLRLGYLVVPPDAVDRVHALRSVAVRQPTSLVEQAVLTEFIVAGHFGRHLRRMRETYAQRLGALQEGVRRQLAGALELSPFEAGLQTAAWLLQPGSDARRLVHQAAARRVELEALDDYALRPLERQGLLLGFAAVPEAETRRAVRELARLLEREPD